MHLIETRRLRLRRWRREDAPFVSAVLGDADVMTFSDCGALDETGQAAWLKDAIAAGRAGPLPGPLAIERKREGDVIGYVSLSSDPKRVGKGVAELGFRLARHAWGNGYATEAANAILDAAADLAGINRIVAIVDPNNAPSIHVLRKAGMRHEGEVMFEGYDYTDHLYGRIP